MTDPREFNRLADRISSATEGYLPGYGNVVNITFSVTEAASVQAALRTAAAESGAGAVKVKPLEWGSNNVASSSLGKYMVDGWNSGTFSVVRPAGYDDGRVYPTLNAAKAAAQADYEARIRSALIPEPAKAGDAVLLRELWRAIDGGPTPFCRDCAAVDGRCHVDDLPCDPQERALEQVKRLREALHNTRQALIGLNGSLDRYWEGDRTEQRMTDICDWQQKCQTALASTAQPDTAAQGGNFQSRVKPWMLKCFGAKIAADKIERNHRFLEEALELVQACGCAEHEAHLLVDYVYGRDQGEINQEVGGVMVTLAALCLANGFDMHAAGETELARIWTKVDQIRAKQAAKPKHSPLPGPAQGGKQSDGGGERFVDSAYQIAEEMRREDRSSEPALAEPAAPVSGDEVAAKLSRVLEMYFPRSEKHPPLIQEAYLIYDAFKMERK